MKVTISRAALLKPLQIISGVVERRQTLPILSNVLITATENQLLLTATDTEIELIGNVALEQPAEPGAVTVAARKLLDICRALPEDAMVQLTLEGGHAVLRSGKSRFLLITLPSSDFPTIEEGPFTTEFTINQAKFKKLLSKIYFAMGQQDVRHYLNGALFDINHNVIKCIATDGHRLAFSSIQDINIGDAQFRVILPRKSVLELMRLLDANSEVDVKMCMGENHFRIISSLPRNTLL